MELEELKKNWELVEKRLERLERLESEHGSKVDYDTMRSTVERLKRRVLRQSFILCLVPLNFWLLNCNQRGIVSIWTWAMVALFVCLVAAGLLHRWRLLERLECRNLSVRETCLVENRFRRSFKIGIMVNVPCALLVLACLGIDFAAVNEYLLTGLLTGMLVGIPLGVVIFLRVWREVKELRRQVEAL